MWRRHTLSAPVVSIITLAVLPLLASEQKQSRVLVNCPSDITICKTPKLRQQDSSVIRAADSSINWTSLTLDGTIEIGSDITTNQIWTANNTYHIVGDINVQALLVIEPGTVIKFAPTARMSVNDGGALISAGTPDNPIIYTSDSATPDYDAYFCAIRIDETASASTKITYNYIEYATYGIWVNNKRLDCPIENNYFYKTTYGILEYGIEHTDVQNNLLYATYGYAIEIHMKSYEGLGDSSSHILIQNNTCHYYQDVGIAVFGVEDEYEAGEVALVNNIVSGSYQCGLVLANGYMYATVANTGYYDNVLNKNWEFDEYNPVIETAMPYVEGTGTLPVCYIRPDSSFINASDEYIEQTRLIGKTTTINSFPDSNLTDIGFHYPNWQFSNSSALLDSDLNQDLIVNFKDFSVLALGWKATYNIDNLMTMAEDWLKTTSDPNVVLADFDGSMKIDFKDFAILAAGWRTTYDIYDLNIMANKWLKAVNPNPPIAVEIFGNPNNLTGKVDVGITGRSEEATQGFIYIDGEIKGWTMYSNDLEITSESASIDTMKLGNGRHEIKVATIDVNGLITLSQTVSVDMNNALYYINRADEFNEIEDYHLYAVSNLPNASRAKFVGWDGYTAWTSGVSVGGLNVTVPSGVLTGAFYNVIIEMETGSPPSFQPMCTDPIKERRKKPGPYKVAIFLPNGTFKATGQTTADCRMRAVAALVTWCEAKNMNYIILYKGECTWLKFMEVLSMSTLNYVYMVAHGGNVVPTDPNYPNPVHRLYFVVSGPSGDINDTERVFSCKGGLPGDLDTNPRAHSMEELGLYQWTYLRCVYMTVCYQGESEEMARKWINYDFAGYPINQLFCGWLACASGYDPDWQDYDYQFWNRWGSGDKLASDVINELSMIHFYIWLEFQTLNGWKQMYFE